MINYRRTDPRRPADVSGIEHMRRLQFGVLAARGRLHMALIVNGIVHEVHRDSPATSRDTVQATALERFPFLGGAIAAPPGDLRLTWRTP